MRHIHHEDNCSTINSPFVDAVFNWLGLSFIAHSKLFSSVIKQQRPASNANNTRSIQFGFKCWKSVTNQKPYISFLFFLAFFIPLNPRKTTKGLKISQLLPIYFLGFPRSFQPLKPQSPKFLKCAVQRMAWLILKQKESKVYEQSAIPYPYISFNCK